MLLAELGYLAVDPVAFRIGSIAVRWYGLAYLFAFVIGFAIMRWLVRRWDLAISDDDLLTVVLACIIGVIIGGRLGYVLFYGEGYYIENPLKALAIWDGGMSFHGGLIGILIAGLIAARSTRIPFLTLCDLGAAGAPVGFMLGRLANYVNGELWGRVTSAPWGVVFPNAGPYPRHPSQLYEAFLEGVVLLVVAQFLARRMPPRPRGEIIGWELALYGVFRVLIEFFREPDAHIGYLAGGWLTMGMLLSVPVALGGFAIVVYARRRKLPQEGSSREQA